MNTETNMHANPPKESPRVLRETTAQWDELPPGAKVVGRRRVNRDTQPGYGIQQLSNELSSGRLLWPKGVFRFKTHEEADRWWTETVRMKAQSTHGSKS
jgi:hypothetical protein